MADVTRQRGFTIIELIAVMIIAAILLVIAAPSFNDFMSKRRVEGVFQELITDLQLARSESVSRNRVVRVTFGTACYVVHDSSPGTSTACTQTTETIDSDDVKIKTVQLASNSNVTLTPQSALTYVEFDPVRGTATWSGSGTAAEVDTGSLAGSWQLRAVATAAGRVRTCSPNASVEGFEAC
jgi:prepilin-type N-terminal cleavage/methylation domain-containing protein